MAPLPALIVPVMFTVPPALVHVPMPPVALKVPPRFTIEGAAPTLIVPALVHVVVGWMVRMPPPLAVIVPVLFRLAATMVMVRPLTWLEISPWLASVIAPP